MLRSLQPLCRLARAIRPRPVQTRAYASTPSEDGPKRPFDRQLFPNSRTQESPSSIDPAMQRVMGKVVSDKERTVVQGNLIVQGYSVGRHGIYLKLGDDEKWFDFAWLREGCKCPRCVDPSTKQRNFNMADIRRDIEAETVQWDGEQLEIRWKNDIDGYDEHTTKYNEQYLRKQRIPFNTLDHGITRYTWTKEQMNRLQHWIPFEEYMNDDAKFALAMRKLSILGMIFVKDIPDSREMVEKLATRMGPLRNTFYGSTWDVRSVPDAKNVAYTDKPLEFHMDLLYMNEPPGIQLLHCLQNSCEGGETLFSDTFHVAAYLRRRHPLIADRLARTILKYEYEHDHAVYSIERQVLKYARHSRSNVPLNVNYSPPFQGHTNWSTWESMKENIGNPSGALNFFSKLVKSEQNVFEMKLQPGECVIFNNRRIAHSRNHFDMNSGQRWLAGAYVDTDALLSRLRRCARDQPKSWNQGSDEIYALTRLSQDAEGMEAQLPGQESERSPV